MIILGLNEFRDIPTFSFDPNDPPDYVTGIYPKLSADTEFTVEADINGDLFAKLCGCDIAKGKKFDVSFRAPVREIQIRRHRKKRINKKWAKLYGYRTIFTNQQIVDCTVMQDIESNVLSIDGTTLLRI